MNGPVLVTGAGGFLGVALVEALLDRGTGVVSLESGHEDRLPERDGLTIEVTDLADRERVMETVQRARPGAVVHLAALHFIPHCIAHPAETLGVNVVGTQNLLDALEGTPVDRIVFASTADVYEPSERPHREGDPLGPINVYGASKIMGELLLHYHLQSRPEISMRVLRLFNVYGPGETNPHLLPSMLSAMRDSDELRLGNLESSRDYVYLADAVAVMLAMLEREGDDQLVNVGTGAATKGSALVDLLRRHTGRSLVTVTDPDRLRPADRPHMAADTARLRELLPDLELTPLEEGVRRTLEAEGLV